MTPALIEGRTKELKEDLDAELLAEVLSRLDRTSPQNPMTPNRRIEIREPTTSIVRTPSSALPRFKTAELELLKELGEHLKTGSPGVCSLAVTCSFGSFTEAVLAGTEEGEVSSLVIDLLLYLLLFTFPILFSDIPIICPIFGSSIYSSFILLVLGVYLGSAIRPFNACFRASS